MESYPALKFFAAWCAGLIALAAVFDHIHYGQKGGPSR